jgi:hypothetical protein
MPTSSSNLVSPAPSSSSSMYPTQSFSANQHPPRAPSAVSNISTASRMSNYRGEDYPHTHDTFASTSAFLPAVTASPPIHPPTYIPPAQHAMAPDPIHATPHGMMGGMRGQSQHPSGGPVSPFGQGQSQGVGMMGPGGMISPGAMTGMGWSEHQSQHRNHSVLPPFAQPPFRQPNGNHQLPPNPLEYGPARTSMPGSTGPSALLQQVILSNGHVHGRTHSAGGEGREKRRTRDEERERGEREEDEVISTIFVVGFPDDMQVRCPVRFSHAVLTTAGTRIPKHVHLCLGLRGCHAQIPHGFGSTRPTTGIGCRSAAASCSTIQW